jgi:hypothetical protein
MSESIRPLLVVFLLAALLRAMRQAAGRLAPKVAIAPLLFLVTRTPVLEGAVLRATACGR